MLLDRCLFILLISNYLVPGESPTLTWIERQILAFGKKIKQIGLAGIVIDLYDAAIQESSKQTYKTGQRAYIRFTNEINMAGAHFPFTRRCLRKTELTMAFFMASLVLRPTIKKASTILCYESHVKQ